MGEIEANRQQGKVSYESNGYRLIFKNNELQIVNRANEIFTYQINGIADLFTVENELLTEWLSNDCQLSVVDLEFFRKIRKMIKR